MGNNPVNMIDPDGAFAEGGDGDEPPAEVTAFVARGGTVLDDAEVFGLQLEELQLTLSQNLDVSMDDISVHPPAEIKLAIVKPISYAEGVVYNASQGDGNAFRILREAGLNHLAFQIALDLNRERSGEVARVFREMLLLAAPVPKFSWLGKLGGRAAAKVVNTGDDLVRVRHHTDRAGLMGIRRARSINASCGQPYGVDFEIQPFANPATVKVGQFARGSYVELTVPRSMLSPIPGYMGGSGNVGRIITNGAPLNISGYSPRYVYWSWLGL